MININTIGGGGVVGVVAVDVVVIVVFVAEWQKRKKFFWKIKTTQMLNCFVYLFI